MTAESALNSGARVLLAILDVRIPLSVFAVSAGVLVVAGVLLSLAIVFVGRWLLAKGKPETAGPAGPGARRPGIYKTILVCAGVAWVALTILLASLQNHGRTANNDSAAVANLRTINTAQVTYLSSSGGIYGEIPDLIAAGLLDSTFDAPRAGYQFKVDASGAQYTATATPVSKNSGRFGYYSTPDAVVRYAVSAAADCVPCFPNGQAGNPVQ